MCVWRREGLSKYPSVNYLGALFEWFLVRVRSVQTLFGDQALVHEEQRSRSMGSGSGKYFFRSCADIRAGLQLPLRWPVPSLGTFPQFWKQSPPCEKWGPWRLKFSRKCCLWNCGCPPHFCWWSRANCFAGGPTPRRPPISKTRNFPANRLTIQGRVQLVNIPGLLHLFGSCNWITKSFYSTTILPSV